ncbi:hypothetical protein EPI10_016400 [Gossypium australe]|uniref:Uncharacterized protein n=1 Tax=Gossypium australe TaxID=47621 RepID=A0A5B6VNV8_9ROSI|nr:hypothetical protein EPI10_016400 [Gossypium australe]
MKVLNENYVTDIVSVNKLDHLGMGSTKALHITTCCKGYTLPRVLIDNRSALNILPLSTLNRLPVDSYHMKACHNIVRAFDGTKRKVMGRIEIPLLIGPNTYKALDSFSWGSVVVTTPKTEVGNRGLTSNSKH